MVQKRPDSRGGPAECLVALPNVYSGRSVAEPDDGYEIFSRLWAG